MANDEHNPEAYRLLFGLIGGGFLAMVLVLSLASLLVIPAIWVAGLVLLWLVAAALAVRWWPQRSWFPVLAGTVLAVVWIAVLTAVGGPR